MEIKLEEIARYEESKWDNYCFSYDWRGDQIGLDIRLGAQKYRIFRTKAFDLGKGMDCRKVVLETDSREEAVKCFNSFFPSKGPS